MNKSSLKITVLIPVKNRIDYLRATINTCVNQEYDNLEIIIADDFSDEPIEDFVQQVAQTHKWVKYVKPPSPGGMRNNFEFALGLVTEGYVMFLGSDDGLIPGAIREIAKKLSQEKIDLMCWDPAIYYYPGVRNESGQIVLPLQKISSGLTSSSIVLSSLANSLNYVTESRLPMIYVKGIVAVSLISSIRAKNPDKRFFQCATPDGFSGITLLGYCKKFYYSTEAFTIYGSSSGSQGSAYLSNTTTAKALSDEFFRQSLQIPMHRELGSAPYSPLITLMTADYLLRAVDLPGWQGTVSLDYRRVITMAIKELSHGLYAPERVVREMEIIQTIAQHHKIEKIFMNSAIRIRKNNCNYPFRGDGSNMKSIFIDCAGHKINGILDAAYFCKTISSIRKTFKVKRFITAIVESVRYKIQLKCRGQRMAIYLQIDPNGIDLGTKK